MKRVYALYYNFKNLKYPDVCIVNQNVWQEHLNSVESSNGIMRWNDCYYLSTSRTALKKKALELIREQIELFESEIKTLENIVVK